VYDIKNGLKALDARILISKPKENIQ
jgi:hypothetical protein